MKKLEVFDPAMCCSTGVCGVDVDPVLARFAADLQWVGEQGVSVRRYNLSQEPHAFAANAAVVKELTFEHVGLAARIRKLFGFWNGSEALLRDCARQVGHVGRRVDDLPHPDGASLYCIHGLAHIAVASRKRLPDETHMGKMIP